MCVQRKQVQRPGVWLCFEYRRGVDKLNADARHLVDRIPPPLEATEVLDRGQRVDDVERFVRECQGTGFDDDEFGSGSQIQLLRARCSKREIFAECLHLNTLLV